MEQNGVTLRYRVFRQLHGQGWSGSGLSPTNIAICLLIVASIVLAVLATEPTLAKLHAANLQYANMALLALFSVELVARVWSAGELTRYAGRFGFLRYLLSFPSLIDLAVIVLFAFEPTALEAVLLRMVRLLRILSLARLGGYSSALSLIGMALRERAYELVMSMGLALLALLLSSTALYLVEGSVQPDRFGSIPRAMWWSVVTLTTVGYGDVAPVTAPGRILAGLTAVIGVGLVAMPAGILAAAFSDILRRTHRRHSD